MRVYKITNIVNGKIYIGITSKSIAERWRGHVQSSFKGSKLHFHNAIRKYGPGIFRWKTVRICSSVKEMKEWEKIFILRSQSYLPDKGYNRTMGGDGVIGFPSPLKGTHKTEEQKLKQSAAMKGRPAWNKGIPMSEVVKIKLSKANKGIPMKDTTRQALYKANKGSKRPHSEETKRKLSESQKGRISPNKGKTLSAELRKKLSEAHKGKILSEEHKKKIGLAVKGNHPWNMGIPCTEDRKNKLSIANKGKVLSKETRRKLSEAAKRQWIRQNQKAI